MRIAGIKIKNFRAIKDEIEMEIDEKMTILLGPNGSGKTTVLDAIDTFFNKSKLDKSDFNSKDELAEITITVTDKDGKLKPYTRKFNSSGSKAQEIKDLQMFKIRTIQADDDPTEYSNENKKTSPLKEMMDEVIRKNPGFKDIRSDIVELYRKEAGDNKALLDELGDSFTKNVKEIEENTNLEFSWMIPKEEEIDTTKTIPQITENGKPVDIDMAGQGAQRLFLYALLKYKTEHNNGDSTGIKPVIIIDEPELHQHPSRHDSFFDVLKKVSNDFQVIYTTHSERYASIDDIERIRFFGGMENGRLGSPKQISYKLIGKFIRHKIETVRGKDDIHNALTDAYMRKHVRSSSESGIISGLFSKTAVLVEGHGDKTALDRVLRHHLSFDEKLEFRRNGATIVICNGKYNMPATYALYKYLGIKTYSIWDYDNKRKEGKKKNTEANKEMCACLDIKTEPENDVVCDSYAIFIENMQDSTSVKAETIYEICNKIETYASNKDEFNDHFKTVIAILYKIYCITYNQSSRHED